MLKRKIKLLITKVICGLLCVLSLVIGGFSLKAYANTNINTTRIEQQVSKGKILLYHSHTCEKNLDSSVVDVGADLKTKLEKKGYIVEHITDDMIQGDYNNAYYHSQSALLNKNLNEYDLIIDLHFDAGDNAITTKDNNGNDVAKAMFVNTKNNINLENETKIANGIKDNMNKFGNNLVRDNCVRYNHGINFYNLHRNKNMVLIEVGGDKNTLLDCKRACTYLASSIDSYLNNTYENNN